MTTVTLKSLYEEGRLTRGDTLEHSEEGDHFLQYVDCQGNLVVADAEGKLHTWTLELPEGCTVVQVK